MQLQQIKETCLYITDIERSRAFYEEKIKLPVIGLVDRRHIFFRAGSSVLLCFIAEASKNSKNLPPHWAIGKQHLAFQVAAEEYEAYKANIKEMGITITHEEQWPNGMESFYFEDPDGHVLEVVPEGMWEKSSK